MQVPKTGSAESNKASKKFVKISGDPLKKSKKSGTTAETSTTAFINKAGSFGRSNSGQDITNIIRKIRLNDYNREKREYLKKKNKELERLKLSNSKQTFMVNGSKMIFEPNIIDVEEEEKEEKIKPKKTSRDKKKKKIGSTSANKKSGTKANNRASINDIKLSDIELEDKASKKGDKEAAEDSSDSDEENEKKKRKKKVLDA